MLEQRANNNRTRGQEQADRGQDTSVVCNLGLQKFVDAGQSRSNMAGGLWAGGLFCFVLGFFFIWTLAVRGFIVFGFGGLGLSLVGAGDVGN